MHSGNKAQTLRYPEPFRACPPAAPLLQVQTGSEVSAVCCFPHQVPGEGLSSPRPSWENSHMPHGDPGCRGRRHRRRAQVGPLPEFKEVSSQDEEPAERGRPAQG